MEVQVAEGAKAVMAETAKDATTRPEAVRGAKVATVVREAMEVPAVKAEMVGMAAISLWA
jgi:hypothetical protein